ncbi:MAG: NADH:ubiquinone oxidoreductase subunit 2 [Candidatus Alkanophagales archaeon MCA70_species_1]|nr:NADH:ubiquinone oxidoreductase subunit 2 [Candidatus Alkanophaga volatiphilum]
MCACVLPTFVTELTLAALVILTLGAAFSYKWRGVGFASAVIALILGLLAAKSDAYGVLVFAVALINLISLVALDNRIKGVDYCLVGLMGLATLTVFTVQSLSLVLAALVLVSVPTYVLVMLREGGANTEIGLKYIVFMVFATVLFFIGAVMLAAGGDPVLGYVLLILGLSLEVGVAPLHEWVPDVFAAADPIPISVIASLAKIVPFVAALRIITSFSFDERLVLFTAALAAFSMFAGNIGALTAREHARVLAYSTVANMGYVLACVACGAACGAAATPAGGVGGASGSELALALVGGLLLLFANSFGKIGFFNAIKGEGSFSPFMFILAFSFIGVPPLLGFWGKFYILLSLVGVGYLWLAAVLVLNSAISIPYYVRLARELGVGWRLRLTDVVVFIVTMFTLATVALPLVEWLVKSMGVLSLGVM